MSSLTLDPVSEYARRVLDGEIIAGELVRAACERHFSDLETGAERGLHFDVESANRAIRFFPAMFTVTGGTKAGEPFHLLDWMTFVVGSLFGWKKGNRLRFRSAYIETGKGQAKSPLMGAIALYMVGYMGIPSAEGYSIAAKLDQAKIPFRDAAALCRTNIPDRKETLESRGDVVISGRGRNAWRIEFRDKGSFFEAKANTDSTSGFRPCIVTVDEVHEINSVSFINLWEAAIDKQPDSAFIFKSTNTPAVDQAVGTEQSEYYQRVVKGVYEDDLSFSYIARVDDDDDPLNDESCWIKALPAIGVTFDYENVRGMVRRAMNDAATQLMVKRLYFGIPVGSSGSWVDEEAWKACLGDIDESVIKGQKCYLSLDLSQKNDLTALSAVWCDDNDFLTCRNWYWTTSGGIERRSAEDRISYKVYVESGELNMCNSETIDYDFVAKQVKDLCAQYEVDSLTVDPSFLSMFVSACNDIGLDVWVFEGDDKPQGTGLKIVRHSQGTKVAFNERNLCMPHSISRLTDKVLKGEILIERNRLTQVCAANVVLKSDAMGNQMFDKRVQRGRMDGMIAIAQGVGASKAYHEQGGSMDSFLSEDFIIG